MGNPKTSDDLYGAFHPTSRITEVSGLGDEGRFSFVLNGEHLIQVCVSQSEDEGAQLVWAEFDDSPRRTLLTGSSAECLAEYFAIYRFFLKRWQRDLTAARRRQRRIAIAGGVSLSIALAGVTGLGLWRVGPAGSASGALTGAVLSELLQAGGASEAAPEAAKTPLKAAAPVSAPSFLDKVSELKSPAGTVIVAMEDEAQDPIVSNAEAPQPSEDSDLRDEGVAEETEAVAAEATDEVAAAPVDLLSRFGAPAGPSEADLNSPVEQLREQYRQSLKNGIATFPNPDGILGKLEEPVLQMPGGGTMEGLEDLQEFGLTP